MAPKEFDPSADPTVLNVARVMSHVVQKGVQAGGVLGVGLVAPIVLAVHKYQGGDMKSAVPKVADALAKTTMTTVALSVAMGATRLARSEDGLKEGAERRAYRLHYNKRAERANLFANVGIAAGGAAAVAFLPATATMVLGGATVGAAAGVAAFVLSTPKKEVKLPAVADM
ncbi:hypothetical protein C2E21_3251 [Chlorella sorokiniana]|jgi:hypothetical protein|uniref:Uncharacterized protein n=1 Tax=Chlorella sorokiniana TaxID=3076 RepID=A0A2P6TVU3_CHLSO|nr:hypothetical protein C2E21_3251 [Chlorella sorokiniana]|eukprot:PRW58181.1 hypothetical protein C2E21_3251 [Chlorella sorokiniana]